jgi:hypothetical protein
MVAGLTLSEARPSCRRGQAGLLIDRLSLNERLPLLARRVIPLRGGTYRRIADIE